MREGIFPGLTVRAQTAMGRIQTNIGLITGIPIADTVEKLMALAARPLDMLVERTNALQDEQVAVTELTALLVAVRYITANLGKSDLFDQREATSSHPDNLAVTMTGTPPKGTYRFTPLRTVQSQQLLSSGFASDSQSLGGGWFSFRFGDHVQRAAEGELLGGGQGIVPGRIRIVDRSGAQGLVDLSTALDVDDVLEAINTSTAINVTAVAHDGGFRLIDNTGQSVSNLKVQEVAGGTTAASLGLAGIDTAGDVADGADVLRLYEDLDLDQLNDGRGVRISSVLPDVHWTLRDGTSSGDVDFGPIDFSPMVPNSSVVQEDTTLGDVIEAINAAAPGKLRAEIAPDGRRLIVTDLTEGDGEFALQAASDAQALADLGLEGAAAVDGVITGSRILGGTKTVLLSSLGGGQGFGQLGMVELTDRSGLTENVDLSAAETLEEVVDAINAAEVGIVAGVNRAQNGIQLTDTTGLQSSNLIVANADATHTAERLGIAVDDDVTVTGTGDMHLQVVAENTRLADLNGGAGVAEGSFRIQDSRGNQRELVLRGGDLDTVGDLVRQINRLGLDLYAEINQTGDGLRIVDTGGGAGTLTVKEGSSTTAADLHLLDDAKQIDLDGQPAQVIDGSATYVIELESEISQDTLLDGFNGGTGVARGTFTILDSSGQSDTLDLSEADPQTVGDVIEMINQLSVDVVAEINSSTNAIRIRDTADGEETLSIIEGNTTTAGDLHLLHDAEEVAVNGQLTQVIDGTADGVWSLDDLRRKINGLGAGVSAMTFLDGSSRPFRLSLTSGQPGRVGQLVVDASQVGFSMEQTARARDALLVVGDAGSAASGVLVSSTSNSFRNVLAGVELQILQATPEPVTVTVDSTDVDLVANVTVMVENYNKFRQALGELTAYDAETDTASVLTGDASALRLDIDLSRFLSGPISGAGPIRSLAEVGVGLNEDGTLRLDESKLKARFAADPKAVEEFFTADQFGLSERFNKLIDQLSDQNDSLLAGRLGTLRDKIARNEQRIEFLNARLDAQQERLLLQFYRMEVAIGKMQADLSALAALQPLAPITSVPRAEWS